MEKFKEVFAKVATVYAEYVDSKIALQTKYEAAAAEGAISINRTPLARTLMKEVRTVNVLAGTLTRWSAN